MPATSSAAACLIGALSSIRSLYRSRACTQQHPVDCLVICDGQGSRMKVAPLINMLVSILCLVKALLRYVYPRNPREQCCAYAPETSAPSQGLCPRLSSALAWS